MAQNTVGFDPFAHLIALGGAEVIPGKNSDTRIKNKAVASDQRQRPLHGRYTRTDTCVRWEISVIYINVIFFFVSILAIVFFVCFC